MNPWEWFLHVVGFGFLMLAIFGGVLLFIGIVAWSIEAVKSAWQRIKPKRNLELFTEEATIEGMRRYKDQPYPEMKVQSFRAGALWGRYTYR